MPRVLIADPDPASSNAILLWLVHRLGVEEILQVADGNCLLEQLVTGQVDAVLMDGALPNRPDPEFFQAYRTTRPNLVLVLLSEKAELSALAEEYAATFVHKALPPSDFLEALQPLLGSNPIARSTD
jgi:DNA-binding NarL/FixJ family response regulator